MPQWTPPKDAQPVDQWVPPTDAVEWVPPSDAVAVEDEPVEGPSLFDKFTDYIGLTNRGVAETIISQPLKLLGAAENKLGSIIGTGPGLLMGAGQAAEDVIRGLNPVSQETEQSFGGQVVRGLGTAAGMLATGGAGLAAKGLGAIPTTGQILKGAFLSKPAFLGGAMTAVPEYEAALKAGATEDEAFTVLLKNYLVGQTEALPMEKFLRMLNKGTEGGFVQVLKNMGEGGFTEAIQETLQTYLSNKIAQGSYDPNRDPVVGLAEAAGVGAIVGAIIPGFGGIAQRAFITEEVDKDIKKIANTGDATINQQIDKEADQAIKEVMQTVTDVKVAAKPQVAETETLTPEKQAVIDKQNRGESVTAEEAALLEDKEPVSLVKAVTEPPVGLTVTDTVVPDMSSTDENATKAAKAYEFNDTAGQAKGTIVKDSASILEIFAAKDEKGNVKKGGNLYGKLIKKLTEGGIRFLSIGMQSEGSKKALEALTNKGVIKPVNAEKTRFEIVNKRFVDNQISELVSEFDKKGETLGATEESKGATKAAASEQVADFWREKGITNREDMDTFADEWNKLHPERPLKPSEVTAAAKLVIPPKVAPETVTIPIQKQIRVLIKTFTEGMETGVRKGQKMVNEKLISKVQEAMKTSNLSRRQVGTILTKIKNSNLFTAGSVSKLQTFIDRAVTDAEYADKVAHARQLQRKLKRLGRRKAETVPVTYKPLARTFSKIDVTELKDIDSFIEKASEVEGGFKPVNDPAYKAPDQDVLEDYADDILDSQEADIVKELKEKESNVDELLVLADNSLVALEQKDLGGFTEKDKKTVEQIKKIDLKQLDEDQLKRFIKIVDNIVRNDNMSGAMVVQNLAEVQQFIGEFEGMKPKVLEQIGLWGRVFNNYANTFKQLYQNSKLEAFLRDFSVQDLLRIGSLAEKTLVNNSKRLDKLFDTVNKKFGVDVRDVDKKAELAVFALFYQTDNESDVGKIHRNIAGTDEKGERGGTIVRHRIAGNKPEAEAWAKAYEPYKNVKTKEEALDIVKKISPYSYEMWKFFGTDNNNQTGIFNQELADEQQEVTYQLHNREYVQKTNYTPIVQHDVNSLFKIEKEIKATAEGEGGVGKVNIEPQQARTAMKRTLNLATNKVYSLEVYTDWMLRHAETFYSNKASRYEARVAEMLHNKKYTELLNGKFGKSSDGKDNATVVAKTLERMINVQRGTYKNLADNEAEQLVDSLLTGLRVIGTVRALAKASQFVLQSTVAFKTYVNLLAEGGTKYMIPGYHAAYDAARNPDSPVQKLLAQTTLSTRGLRMGGTDRGSSEAYKLQRGNRKNFFKALERGRIRIDRNTRKALSTIVVPDVMNARAAFVAYYLHNLETQGVKDVNLNTEWQKTDQKERRLAIAHAENMVEQTQTASNPAALSLAQAQSPSKGWQVFKNIFLPFSTFDADFKARLVNEYSAMKNAPSAANTLKFGGSVGEAFTFATMSTAIAYFWGDLLRDAIRGLLDLEEKEKTDAQKAKEVRQRFTTSVTSALNPFAFGTIPQEIQNTAINEIGHLLYNPNNLSKKEWMKENAWVYDPREGSTMENLGAYSTGLSPVIEAFNTIPAIQSFAGEPVKTIDSYGNERYVELSDDQKMLLSMKLMVEGLTMSGLTEADIANAVRAVWKEQLKLAPTAGTSPIKQDKTKSTRRFKRPND